MCTVSWVRQSDGYRLFCNRDEKRTRKPAFLPWTMERLGVRFIAPIDGDFGGSWIGVNEFGVALSLLNGPPAVTRAEISFKSRGLLLVDLLSSASVAEVLERMEYAELPSFQPFTLAALEPGAAARIVRWDGTERSTIAQSHDGAPLASSSYDHQAANATRAADYQRLSRGSDLRSETLDQLHRSHWPRAGALSACMHRADAETVSFSQVRVDGDRIEFLYSPAAPCRQAPSDRRVLARRS